MRHLTESELLQFVDSTADYATMAFCTNHLAVCEHCRREVEFQKSISRIIRRIPLPETSSKFTNAIVNLILPSAQSRFGALILNNLGSIFGMIMVLSAGVIIYSVAVNTQFTQESASTSQSTALQEVAKAIVSTSNDFLKALPLVSIVDTVSKFRAPLLWSTAVLVLLLSFDRLLGGRAIRSLRRLKH
jgi:hypothetical protein